MILSATAKCVIIVLSSTDCLNVESPLQNVMNLTVVARTLWADPSIRRTSFQWCLYIHPFNFDYAPIYSAVYYSFAFLSHFLLLGDTTSLIGVISQTASLVACLGTLSKSSGQFSSEVGGVDVVEPAWVRKIGINDLLWVDEEVLSCAGHTGVLVGQRGNEHGRLAVVVELPVDRALWADGALVQANRGVHR